jgi:hypothetical protein
VKINRDNRCSKYVLITVENTSTLNDVKLAVEKLEGIEPSEKGVIFIQGVSLK